MWFSLSSLDCHLCSVCLFHLHHHLQLSTKVQQQQQQRPGDGNFRFESLTTNLIIQLHQVKGKILDDAILVFLTHLEYKHNFYFVHFLNSKGF